MNHRENLLSLLHRQGYDEAPVEFMLCPALEQSFSERIAPESSDYRDHFGMPWRRLSELKPDNADKSRFLAYHFERLDVQTELDEWGIGHKSTPSSMHMTRMFHPLADADSVEQIESYPLASYRWEDNTALAETAEALHDLGLAAVGNMQCTIWETAWYLRGMENLMIDMMSGEKIAEALLDRVTEMSLRRALLYAQAGADILFLGDDIGTQKSIMMSEKLYCAWLKPRLAGIINAVKQIRPDILIFYHSCGYIEPFIPHLIEVGIDVLNPIQPECMSVERVLTEYRGALSFHGAIGTQSTMPFSTPEEVKETIRRYYKLAGENGGLFAAPTHLLEPEVPWQNILAYVEACREIK